MRRLRLQQRAARPRGFAITLPLLAVATTFLVTAGFVLVAGESPFAAYRELFYTPLSSEYRFLEVLVGATPILFTGAAVAVAFRAGYWNIGAEGQLLCGAIAAAWLGTKVDGWPAAAALPLLVLGGAAAGALWALPPAIMRTRLGIDEVVTTLLLNPVALLLVGGLLNGPWRDPVTRFPESPRIAAEAEFPQLVDRSRLHVGFLLALLVLALAWFVVERTPTGLRLRALGLSPGAARFAGVRVERALLGTALASGAIAGIAGVSEVAGIQFRLTEGISPGFGYTGIVVATLGGLTMVGVALAAFLLGLVNVGSGAASRVLDVPSQLGNVIVAALLLVTVTLLVFGRYRITRGGAR